MLLLGSLFFAGPPFLYPFVRSPDTLLLLRFLHGFATAIFAPVAAAFVADLARRDRGEKLGWFTAASDLGGTVGPLLGGFLLFYTASYTMTYLAVGLLGLLPLFVVLLLPKDEKPSPGLTLGTRSRQFWLGIREVLSSRAVLLTSMVEAILYVGYGTFLGFFPPYAKGIGLDDARITLVVGAQLATTMLAKPLSGRLSDRLGRKPLILNGFCPLRSGECPCHSFDDGTGGGSGQGRANGIGDGGLRDDLGYGRGRRAYLSRFPHRLLRLPPGLYTDRLLHGGSRLPLYPPRQGPSTGLNLAPLKEPKGQRGEEIR